MSKKIFSCTALIFAFTFGGFAEDGVDEVKAESKPADVAVEAVKEEVKEEAQVKEEVKEEAQKENAMHEAVADVKKVEKKEESSGFWGSMFSIFGDDDVKAEEKPAELVKTPDTVVEVEKKGEENIAVAPVVVVAPVVDAKVEANVADDAKPGFLSRAGRAILLWLPNRLIDVTDIISMDIGIGSEVAMEFNVTKYLGFGGAFGEKYFLQKGFSRQYGGAYRSGWDYQILCFNSEKRYLEDSFGSTRGYYLNRKNYGSVDSTNHSYVDRVRDFWAIEVEAGWLIELGVGIHPVEIADLLSGIFFLDSNEDDFE